MAVEGKANAMNAEQNLERPASSEGMLKSYAMTHAFKNRPLRRFHQILISNTSRVKAQVDQRFLRPNTLSEALRQFSRRTLGKRRTMNFVQGGTSKEKSRRWSALAMTLPSGISGDQGMQPETTSLSSQSFSSGSSIPAFSLPDQGSIFSQVPAVEQTVSKPKWKPPEPGARRFSHVEEVKPSKGAEVLSNLGTASPDATVLQKSPKPGQPSISPTPGSTKTDLSTKPTQAAARQGEPPAPAREKPVRQESALEVSGPRSTPRQQTPQVSEPAPEASQPPARQEESLSPVQQMPVSQTPPAHVITQAAQEPKPERQAPSPERGQAASPFQSQPEAQPPTASKAQSQTPNQELAEPVQMPLAPRRGLARAKITRQAMLSQHKYQLNRPQQALRKATTTIQRKTIQLPLKRPPQTLPPQTPANLQNLKPVSLPTSHPLIQSETALPVTPKAQTAASPAPKTQAEASTTMDQPAVPSLQTLSKTMPLQRKSLYLPLKRPALAARKPSAVQTRRLNIAAMPLRQSLAKVGTEKEGISRKAGLPPTAVKTSPAKPARSSQAATPGPALPTRLTTGAPQTPAPKADLAQEPSSEIAPAPAPGLARPAGLATESFKLSSPKADQPAKLASDSAQAPAPEINLLSTQPAEAPALPSLPLPLISKTLMQRLSGRRQLLQARPMTRWQREPANFPSARSGQSRNTRLPGQFIQRSLRKGYPLIPTRSVQRQEPESVERLSDNAAKIPSLRSKPTRFEAAQAPENTVPIARATAVKPEPPAELQTSSQAQVQAPQQAPQPVLQSRRKVSATQTEPPSTNRNKVLSLSALRKGKPVLAPHSTRKASVETGQTKAGPLPKPEGKPAVTGPVSRQSLTPIRAIKSTPVVQRKPQQEDEGWMYQSESQNLPLASQPPAPPMGPASQSQSSFASSSGRNAPQQQSMPPAPPLPPSSSNLFAEEERPEMPLRTPPRPSTSESPTQSTQEMSGLLDSMLEESHATDTSGPTPPPTEEQKRANLQELARKVYPEIIRMLNVETEWFGSRH